MADTSRKGTLFYFTWIEQLRQLPPDVELEIIHAILDYDMTGKKADTENPIVKVLLEKYYFEVDLQKQNYDKKSRRYQMSDFAPHFAAGLSVPEVIKATGAAKQTVYDWKAKWDALPPEEKAKSELGF